ncbi:MAG: class I SAM-dependent methyltransferase [Bacteroidales bacterium]|nr:class I SAM-dependent methyltransferase [Bacteroidales bacterium]
MRIFLKNLANNAKQGSLADRLRQKRFRLFLSLIHELPRPIKIIDVGGTGLFWERMGFTGQPGVSITLINLKPSAVDYEGFTFVTGDALDLKQFGDQEFDIAFSNSVIEHVGSFGDQQKMAAEMMRVAKKIFLQTPNYYFPLEPHFLFPFFQFFPLWLQASLLQYFNLGWYNKVPDRKKAIQICLSVRLLKKSELKRLFPGARFYEEKFFGLVKSFIVLK